ncbi:MAG: hypothetical protein B6243_08320 [Anaerolineaceae bacterium 4572_5.2]|nr:MAG: hypothetical protein B6243_08320 [Anaerolineaceae bacterium 4572_5.2]
MRDEGERVNLDARFAGLPVPQPKQTKAKAWKQRLRLLGLQAIGKTLPKARPASTSDARKILLIRPDHLGDLLFLTPTLRYLRTLLPKAHLTLLLGPWGEALMRGNPHLDEILSCQFPGFTRQPKPSVWQPYQYLQEQAALLRPHNFDQAVILRFDHWWGAWLAAAANIPQRIGYATPEVIPFLTDPLPYRSNRHEVEQNWRLAHFAWSGEVTNDERRTTKSRYTESIGPLEFFISPEEQAWAEKWLVSGQPSAAIRHSSLVTRHSLVVIHPGAGATVKLWRERAWAELAQRLSDERNCRIIFSGGPAERDLCQRIAGQVSPKPMVAAGETSLGELAALMRRASLVIGPDTGPLKLAAAVGTSTLQLYGPVDPLKFGPWGGSQRHRIVTANLPCQPCNAISYSPQEAEAHFCARGLSLQSVLTEALDLLSD